MARTSETPDYDERHETIEVKVTENGTTQTFKLFRALTEKYAPSFASMFKFAGVKIELCNVSVRAVKVFAGWLRSCWIQDHDPRTGEPYEDFDFDSLVDDEMYYEIDAYPLHMFGATDLDLLINAVHVFVFAEVYGIPRLRQDAIDRMYWDLLHESMPPARKTTYWQLLIPEIWMVYQNTVALSPVRRLLVDGFLEYAADDDCIILGRVPAEFARAVVFDGKRTGRIRHPCYYHEHADRQALENCIIRAFDCHIEIPLE